MKKLKFRLVYIIHGVILFAIITTLIYTIKEFPELHENNAGFGNNYSINSIWYTLTRFSIFRMLIFFILPTIGIFMKNKFGWFFIASYFYFVIGSTIGQLYFSEIIDLNLIMFNAFWVGFIVLLLVLLNRKEVSFGYYKIVPKSLFKINTISFIIGLSISLFLVIKNNLHYFDSIPVN